VPEKDTEDAGKLLLVQMNLDLTYLLTYWLTYSME